MAWEWVAPVATAVSGIVGIGFTWYAGHQGRQHVERVADKTAASQLALAREARRAEAYADILTMVLHATTAASDGSAPSFNGDIGACTAKAALHCSEGTNKILSEWSGHLTEYTNVTNILSEGPPDASQAAVAVRRKEAAIEGMNSSLRCLQKQLNAELTK
ncbi:hypothetical protein ACIBH1_40760 [Nonomuraea sp. NPDC050663]|uniref:hypothetical protein n=1 Tax=Nonomuraea sp. NPDC050663 TaxID=3364370 RepID=UPI0037AE1189